MQPQQDVPDNEPTYDAEADADDQPHILDPYKTKKAAAAIWILKVQENYMLPQSTMEQILKDVTGFFQDTLLDLQEDVNSCLSSAGIDHSSIPGLAHLFDRSSEYAAPFAGLETHYRHMKYCKEVLGYVVCIQSVFMVYTWYTCYYLTCYSCQFQEPQPVLLGVEKQWKGTGQKRMYAEVKHEMMYVPILETIQSLLDDAEVVKQVWWSLRLYRDGVCYTVHVLTPSRYNLVIHLLMEC